MPTWLDQLLCRLGLHARYKMYLVDYSYPGGVNGIAGYNVVCTSCKSMLKAVLYKRPDILDLIKKPR